MKKLSTYLFLILFSFSVPSFADDKKELKVLKDYSFDLNDNIINFGWKIKSKRNTSKYDIYILTKNSWILYCVVEIEDLRTKCNIP